MNRRSGSDAGEGGIMKCTENKQINIVYMTTAGQVAEWAAEQE